MTIYGCRLAIQQSMCSGLQWNAFACFDIISFSYAQLSLDSDNITLNNSISCRCPYYACMSCKCFILLLLLTLFLRAPVSGGCILAWCPVQCLLHFWANKLTDWLFYSHQWPHARVGERQMIKSIRHVPAGVQDVCRPQNTSRTCLRSPLTSLPVIFAIIQQVQLISRTMSVSKDRWKSVLGVPEHVIGCRLNWK